MKIIKIILTGWFILILSTAFSQKNNVWLTYGQSTFLYSPGVEFNFFFKKYIGFQIGASTYFEDYNSNKIVNKSSKDLFNFHNANIGLCSNILTKKNSKLGLTLGFKIYYGPEYKHLHYYKDEGYYIYFDASELRPAYGVDFGLFYSYKRITGLLKFDTARKNFRFGFGYTFGKFKE